MRSLAGNLFTVIGMCFLFLAVSIFTGGTAQASCGLVCDATCSTVANCAVGTCAAGVYCSSGGGCKCVPRTGNLSGCICT